MDEVCPRLGVLYKIEEVHLSCNDINTRKAIILSMDPSWANVYLQGRHIIIMFFRGPAPPADVYVQPEYISKSVDLVYPDYLDQIYEFLFDCLNPPNIRHGESASNITAEE